MAKDCRLVFANGLVGVGRSSDRIGCRQRHVDHARSEPWKNATRSLRISVATLAGRLPDIRRDAVLALERDHEFVADVAPESGGRRAFSPA